MAQPEQRSVWDSVSGFFGNLYDTAQDTYDHYVDGVKAWSEGKASIEQAKAREKAQEQLDDLETGSTASTGYDPQYQTGIISVNRNTLVYAALGLIAIGVLRK